MTDVTITLFTQGQLTGVFLHHPGGGAPEPLPGVAHSVTRDLPDGTYQVSAAGAGLPPGTSVMIRFKTVSNSKIRGGRVKPDGTIALLKQYDLNGGVVS